MNNFNFGLGRKSGADSVDDERSRYAPSSIYSGPVGGGESRVASTAMPFTPMALQGPFQEQQPRYLPVCSLTHHGQSVADNYSPIKVKPAALRC